MEGVRCHGFHMVQGKKAKQQQSTFTTRKWLNHIMRLELDKFFSYQGLIFFLSKLDPESDNYSHIDA